MAEHNPDYDSVLVELLSVLQRIAICQILEGDDVEQDELIKELSPRISKEDVQLYYQVGILGRKDLPVAPDPRTGFEMTLIRMLAFRPAGVEIPEASESKLDAEASDSKACDSKPNEAKVIETTQAKDNASVNTEKSKSMLSDANEEIKTNSISKSNIESEDTANWQSIIDEMSLVGLVKELAGHCALKEHNEGKVHLVLSPDKEHLLNQTQKERLANALGTRFGKGTQLKISIEEPEAETPAQKKAREEKERQKVAESSLKGDANVKAMEEIFGATLDEKSIRPA
jgi:DNA polymerase-3 subunit gamma/tau